MVRPEISAVTPMEIITLVVLRSRCRAATITAAVEPLTMPQISPTTSLHTELTRLALDSRRMGLLAALFLMGGHGVKRLGVGRRHRHADHIEHDAQGDKRRQHKARHHIARSVQRSRGEKTQQRAEYHRHEKDP